jgi:hypothetical protein
MVDSLLAARKSQRIAFEQESKPQKAKGGDQSINDTQVAQVQTEVI